VKGIADWIYPSSSLKKKAPKDETEVENTAGWENIAAMNKELKDANVGNDDPDAYGTITQIV
jgi:hypothetical protein